MRAWLCALLLVSLSGCSAAPLGQRTVDDVRTTGSLRGSELDGAWVLPPRGRLQTEPALRRRFDHLLTAVGECGLPEIRRFIEREVTRDQGAAATTQVLAAWDEHLVALQGRPGANAQAAENAYPAQEAPATRSLRRPAPLPRSLLAPDEPGTAEELRALHAQRVERFGADAAQRLRREDEARWDWSRRMAEARAELKNLSAPAQQEAALARRFSGTERLRARALLGLSP
jgi:lipase chaperone LimK